MSFALQLPRTNLVIGGNFSTNPWQRGTTFTALGGGSNFYNADRFKYFSVGAGVVDISKATDAPTVAQAGILTQNSLKVNVTTADAAIGAADDYNVYTSIEGYNYSQIAQRDFVLSFWHKHTLTGTYCISVHSGAVQDMTYIAEYTQTTTNTWEYASFIIPASPIAGSWNYANGAGLFIFFSIAAGANAQAAPNIWMAGSATATVNQVNSMGTIGNNFAIQLIQVRDGTQIQPWETRTERDELALCQRYFFKSFIQGTAPAQNVGVNTGECDIAVGSPGATANYIPITFPTTMRTTPTITTYSPGAASVEVYNTSAGTHTNTALLSAGDRGVYILSVGNGAGVVTQTQAIHITADADF